MKKFKSPAIALVLVFAMLFSAISMPNAMQANKKKLVKNISGTKISMSAGAIYVLKTTVTKTQLTFSSSKKTVATVDSTGTIFAKKRGKTKITVKNNTNGAKQTFSLRVKKAKGYTISKTSGTFPTNTVVTLKAKKGYKVYFSTKSSFKKKSFLASGSSKKFTFSTSTNLRVFAVKASKKITTKKLKKSVQTVSPSRSDYQFKIIQTTADSSPSATASASASPVFSTDTPQSTTPASITPPPSQSPSSSPFDVTDGAFSPVPDTAYDEADENTNGTDAIDISILSENNTKQEFKDADGNIIYSISKKNKISIEQSGTYRLSGSSESGRIEVNVDGTVDSKTVHLILAGVNLASNDTDGVISIKKNTARVILTLEDGTINTLADTAAIATETSDSSTEETLVYPDGALVCRQAPLTINGNGSLFVSSELGTGIKATGILKIMSGNITVSSAGKNGISSKNSLGIEGGILTVTANGDGIKTTTPDDTTNTTLGHMNINNADITVTSKEDALQSYGGINLENANLTLTATKDSNKLITVEGETKDSFKGIKAGSTITITGGAFQINSSDDSIHTNGSMALAPDTMTMSSGDDGIHADNSLQINNGTITITNSYEGIEGANITVSGGNLSIRASDDGFNGAGGNDTSTEGEFGNDTFGPGIPNTGNSNYQILFSGGSTYVNADGDGLDANGSLYMTGGTVYVDGPTNNGNGALDFDSVFEISGGTLVAVGSAGMTQTPSTTSTQPSVQFNPSQTQSANTPLALKNASGNVLVTHTPAKQYQVILISSPDLQINSAYSLYLNNQLSSTITLSGIVTGGSSGGNTPPGRG